MKETRGVTRWRRSAILALPATVAVGAMTVAIAEGAMAASFNLSGVPFTLKSNQMAAANGMAVIMDSINTGGGATPTTTAAAEVGLKTAGLDGICIHATQSVGLPVVGTIGTWSLIINTPGTGLTPAQLTGTAPQGIQASNMILSAQSVAGGTTNLNATATTPDTIGAASDSTNIKNTGIADAQVGQFGLDATGGEVDVAQLNASANGATIGGSLKLTSLNVSLANGAAPTGAAC